MGGCPRERQSFEREKDGRVFTCKRCGSRTCVDCDRPEHVGENCDEYQARTMRAPTHVTAGAPSRQILQAYKRTPCCDTPFQRERCNYIVCVACKFQFCSDCLVPWVGEHGALTNGKDAHKHGCHYKAMEKSSTHTLKHRFEENRDVLDKFREDIKAKKVKRE
jgi:hypothetical protein